MKPYTFECKIVSKKYATHSIQKVDNKYGKAGKEIEHIEDYRTKELYNGKGIQRIYPTSNTHFFLKITDPGENPEKVYELNSTLEKLNSTLKKIKYKYIINGIESPYGRLSKKDIESVIKDILNDNIDIDSPRRIEVVIPRQLTTNDRYKILQEELNDINELLDYGDSFNNLLDVAYLFHKNKELIKYFKENIKKTITDETFGAAGEEYEEIVEEIISGKPISHKQLINNLVFQSLIVGFEKQAKVRKRTDDAKGRVKKDREKEKEENAKKGIVPKPKGRPKKEK